MRKGNVRRNGGCHRAMSMIAMAGLAVGFACAAPSFAQLQWTSGTTTIVERLPSDKVAEKLTQLAARDGEERAVVHFEHPLTREDKDALANAGVKLLTYLGGNSYFAHIDGNSLVTRTATRAVPMINAEEIDSRWKMHPDLLAGVIHPWSIVEERVIDPDPIDDKEGAADESRFAIEAVVAAYVLFHADVNVEAEGAEIVRKYGASVRSVMRSANGLVIHLPSSSIDALAKEDKVMWVEPPLPKFSELNAENRVITQVDQVQAAPYGLNGAGVTVLVYDGGTIRTTHLDFQGRSMNIDTDAVSDHATHVTGTVLGGGVADPTETGMAPGANSVNAGFETGGPLQPGFLYTDPGDLEADYTLAINTHGADISNNSIGTNTAPNGFPCEWEGDYATTSILIDNIVRGSLGAPFRIVWANGNERQGSARCGSTYHTTAPPACAKNHITVGALNANDDSVTSFTSWGPADDGRMKPDISGPGCQAGGDGGVRSAGSASDTTYTVKCGTSMSSPTVTGISALILQDYRANFPGEPDFRNSTLKTFLAHTAVDLFNPGPDYQTGYGSVRAKDAIDFMRTGNFFENEVDQSTSYLAVVIVQPGDPELKITLAWDDAPGAPNTIPELVNDLDLVVTSPSNVRAFPWTLGGLANPANPAVRTQENHVDNIEQVFVENPEAGAWLVEIRGTNVPVGPQPFSLCASPFLVNCSDMGVVQIDANQYNCASTVGLKVIDCGLNTSDMIVDTVVINVSSTSEGAGESVLLTETAAESATFTGTINVSTSDSMGVLLVAHGDTITATYNDADDGSGSPAVVMDTAAIDCVPPVISNVAAMDIQPRSANITFDTDEAAAATVRYGLACGSLTESASALGSNTSHSILLSSLQDDTQYFYEVEVVDAAGNVVVDDNGGACYSFTTPMIPDFFTQLFPSANDLEGIALLFIPNMTIDEYSVCEFPVGVLPVDPAGGTNLTLTDTGNAQITFGGGATVKLYGVDYNSCFVGANGYITFTAGDTDTTETIADHFDLPRISALFDDLDPSEGGQVSWKQDSEAVTVTWFDIPEDATGGGNRNTFQVSMFFDGRIQIAWAEVNIVDGLAGLSKGLGIDPDFFESDLSEYGSCGPRPPLAGSQNVTTPQNVARTITLLASDDGEPNPPGAITYTIESLPAQDLRDLGNNQLIVSVPYVLSSGNQVSYEPSGGFGGFDSFMFHVNDGGTPPDGGDSNTATVTILVEPVLDLPFFDDFPSTTFDPLKWSLVETADIDGVGIAEPSEPNSARFNGTPDGSDAIVTHFINLAQYGAAKLRYFYEQRGGGEAPDSGDDLIIEYLDAGSAWVEINRHLGSGPDETTYTEVLMDLPLQALHSAFKLRIRNTATSGAFDDWFVDNVEIFSPDAPVAFNVAISTQVNVDVDVTLNAVDGNMEPLTYTITSLPGTGSLSDPNAGAINSVPYTLAAGGNEVHFDTPNGFQGLVSFNYHASDDTFDSNTATVEITVGGPQIFFEALTDDTDPGWTTTGQWAFGMPTGSCPIAGRCDPSSGFTGSNVYGYNLAGHYPNNLTPVQWLTSGAIDCSMASGVELEFKRWLGVESASFDHATVQVSNDGSNWTTVWDHTGVALNEAAWSTQTYDISAVADNQSTVFLRWGMGVTDGSVTYQGWNIDDVVLRGLIPVPAGCDGDADGDEDVDVNDISYIVFRLGNSPGSCGDGDVDSNGSVDVNDISYTVFRLGTCNTGGPCN